MLALGIYPGPFKRGVLFGDPLRSMWGLALVTPYGGCWQWCWHNLLYMLQGMLIMLYIISHNTLIYLYLCLYSNTWIVCEFLDNPSPFGFVRLHPQPFPTHDPNTARTPCHRRLFRLELFQFHSHRVFAGAGERLSTSTSLSARVRFPLRVLEAYRLI